MILLLIVFSVVLSNCKNGKMQAVDKNPTEWNYPDSLDAFSAAPNSHEILLENDKVRVIKVTIKPGEKEPMHTHQWESIMIVEHPARIRYYDNKNNILFESDKKDFKYEPRKPGWMGREGLHAVENIDSIEYSATRIELKK